MTDTGGRATFDSRRGYLDTLAGYLWEFDRQISLSRTGVPMLIVTNPRIPVLSDYVLCCRDVDGTLAYFWPWGARLAAVEDPETAALAVERMLSS